MNDCLFYTSFIGSPSLTCSLRLHNEIPLFRMEVQVPLVCQDCENEFKVISTSRSFTLAACSLEDRDEWISALNEAISQYQFKQLSFNPTKTLPSQSVLRIGQ